MAWSVYLVGATIFFFIGISNIGLAKASAIMMGIAVCGTLGQLALSAP